MKWEKSRRQLSAHLFQHEASLWLQLHLLVSHSNTPTLQMENQWLHCPNLPLAASLVPALLVFPGCLLTAQTSERNQRPVASSRLSWGGGVGGFKRYGATLKQEVRDAAGRGVLAPLDNNFTDTQQALKKEVASCEHYIFLFSLMTLLESGIQHQILSACARFIER